MLKKISAFIFGPFFDEYAKELEKEVLGSCDTLLDVGCGADSPIKRFSKKLSRSVGVDAHRPSAEQSRRSKIHTEYQEIDVLDIGAVFPEKSFDCVLMSDLIEHLPKPEALKLVAMAERLAKKKVIIFTPNGFLKQGEYDDNPYQVHVSGWDTAQMRKMGYRVRGINGWKPLRTENARIAWQPSFFWGKVSLLSQPLVAGCPEQAFHLLCVKDL